MTQQYLSLEDVGRFFGVGRATVSVWRGRYPDTPPPDAVIGRTPGWLPESKEKWLRWFSEKGPGR